MVVTDPIHSQIAQTIVHPDKTANAQITQTVSPRPVFKL